MVAELRNFMTQNEIKDLIESLKSGDQNVADVSADDLRGLLELNPEGPYQFVNLLKYKKQADYPEGHLMAQKELSGQEAYNLYGMVALKHVIKRGGRLMQSNMVKLSMGGGDWDSVATMEYQNISAFFDMLVDPDYQAALVHRDAGLEATEVLVSKPILKGPVGGSA